MKLVPRRATPGDIPRIVEMGQAFTDSIASPVPFDADGFAERMAQFIAHPDALILLLDDGTEAVGGLGAFAAPHFLYLRPVMASELFWWIEPDYRGGSAALRLLDIYEQWAVAKGCGAIAFSMFAGDDKVRRVIERKGFKLYELAFAKPIEHELVAESVELAGAD